MYFVFAIFATYIACVLDTAVVPLLGWDAFGPRIAFLTLVEIGRLSDNRAGLLAAAVWGLFVDGLSQAPLGINVVTAVIAVRCVQGVRGELRQSPLLAGAVTGVVAFLIPVASGIVEFVINQEPLDGRRQFLSIAGPACTTAGLAFVLRLISCHLSGKNTSATSDNSSRVSNRWRMLAE